jgi:hydroxylamine reductase
MDKMFCFQCEQTAKGTGCTMGGICGKDQEVANLQDELLGKLKGIAAKAIKESIKNSELDKFLIEGLFTTITNVDFDPQRLKDLLKEADKYPQVKVEQTKIGIKADPDLNEDILSLRELLMYGIKGLAAYADHALILGYQDQTIFDFVREALAALLDNTKTAEQLTALVLKCGEVNYKTMELLDKANTETYGHPEPTKVRITPLKGKAILVSGHDLKDLYELLKQTEWSGINIYTHGEMLPTNAYPKLKAFKHLAGNYGGAWQDQQKEFEAFPGAILMTTNCIQKPRDTYKHRIFTTGLVAWPGVTHLENGKFQPLIEAALKEPGFQYSELEKFITVGFARQAVLGVANKVINLVKQGKIKHFFLIGGCDGAKSGRNYYTDFATKAPKDTLILTLACGKYRFNKLEFGDIEGIPRLLDVGQCNDAYSALQIALALAKAFGTDVNSLPLSLILSWYEQKAVVILLTLLWLGIKNIRLGPTLPAFVSPNVLKLLVDKFNIMPIKTAEEDLKAILK